MAIISKSNIVKPEIDLHGPDGNVFALMGYVKGLCRQIGLENAEEITQDMMSSDYEHAVEVFDKHFGEYVDLIR